MVNLPPIPDRLKARPVDERGYPVPWFVLEIEKDKFDFRVIAPNKHAEAIALGKCWICGEPLGAFKQFVIGPLSAVQRISGEPPSHRDCAEFAVQACPFIANPRMGRSPRPMPADTTKSDLADVKGNPGVYCVWSTRWMLPFNSGRKTPSGDGILIQIGEPSSPLQWWAGGRLAIGGEVREALDRNWDTLMACGASAATKAVWRRHREEILTALEAA